MYEIKSDDPKEDIINIITTKEGKEQEIALGLKEEYYGDKEKIKECSNL